MKHIAIWILHVLADMTRCMDKQKPRAKTAACGASLCCACPDVSNCTLQPSGVWNGDSKPSPLSIFQKSFVLWAI